jgi:hypothetical protein
MLGQNNRMTSSHEPLVQTEQHEKGGTPKVPTKKAANPRQNS